MGSVPEGTDGGRTTEGPSVSSAVPNSKVIIPRIFRPQIEPFLSGSEREVFLRRVGHIGGFVTSFQRGHDSSLSQSSSFFGFLADRMRYTLLSCWPRPPIPITLT